MSKSKEIKKTIWDLDLHEELWVWDWLAVVRVPGGFLYSKYDYVNNDTLKFSNMVFVPEVKK